MGLVLSAAPAEGDLTTAAHHVVTPPQLLPEEAALGTASHNNLLLELLEVAVHGGELGVLGELGAGGGPVVLLAAPDAGARPADAGHPGHGEVPPPGHPPAAPAPEDTRIRGQSRGQHLGPCLLEPPRPREPVVGDNVKDGGAPGVWTLS